MRVLQRGHIGNLENVGFSERRNTEYREKNPRNKATTNNKLNYQGQNRTQVEHLWVTSALTPVKPCTQIKSKACYVSSGIHLFTYG